MAWEISISTEGWTDIRENLADWTRDDLIAAIIDDKFEMVLERAGQCHAERAAVTERKPILFYAARHPLGSQLKPVKKPKAEPKPKNQYADLLDGLRSLGLDVTATVVEPVVRELFPAGLQKLDCGDVIRAVFLKLKRRDS